MSDLAKIILCAAVIGCALLSPAQAIDPRCNTGARYQAMSEADLSGWGMGHACAAPIRAERKKKRARQ